MESSSALANPFSFGSLTSLLAAGSAFFSSSSFAWISRESATMELVDSTFLLGVAFGVGLAFGVGGAFVSFRTGVVVGWLKTAGDGRGL
jgi:hypothetical protein